ncbi:MAG: hypothetical protein HY451_01210 [Parcubacteria group bacterium]|nr:hypothetical protein [Parcubacteria group bacterium]
MRKVAEFIETYKKTSEKEKVAVLTSICLEMLGDIFNLAKARNAKSNSAFVGILEEVNNRWERFASHFEGELNKDAFIEIHRGRFPEVHSIWMQTREDRRRRASVHNRGHDL